MLTGTLVLVKRSEQITELNIDGMIGLSEENPSETPIDSRESYAAFQKQLEAIRQITTPEIVVNIRSAGGNVNDALLIHDILCESGKLITTRCYGYVASAATLIAQAASKGRREMSANSLYLIHRATCSGSGNVDTLSQTVDLLNQTDRRIAELYAARAGKTTDHFLQLMAMNHGNGKWLCAREAKTAGLIDRIIPAQKINDEIPYSLPNSQLPALPEPACKLSEVWMEAALRLLQKTVEKLSEKCRNTLNPSQPPSENSAPARSAEPQTIPNNTTNEQPDPVAPSPNTPKRPPIDPPLRMQARATSTEKQEDPGYEEPLASPNARSYQQDAEQFTL